MARGWALNGGPARRPKVACRPLLVLQRSCWKRARAPPATTGKRSPAHCRNSCARLRASVPRPTMLPKSQLDSGKEADSAVGSRALHPPSSASPTAGKSFLTSAQFLTWTGWQSASSCRRASSFPSVTTLQPWGFFPFIRCFARLSSRPVIMATPSKKLRRPLWDTSLLFSPQRV